MGGQVGPSQVLEVHGEEGDVGEDVPEPEAVVELEAVEHPGPVVQAEDVVGEQIRVIVMRGLARTIGPSVSLA